MRANEERLLGHGAAAKFVERNRAERLVREQKQRRSCPAQGAKLPFDLTLCVGRVIHWEVATSGIQYHQQDVAQQPYDFCLPVEGAGNAPCEKQAGLNAREFVRGFDVTQSHVSL